MGRTCTDDKQEETILICHHNKDREDDEEDDILSLRDLPVNATEEDEEFDPRKEDEEESSGFEFRLNPGSRIGSGEPTGMSTADELFFKGRILPLRHSLSSDTRRNRWPATVHFRSGSMDIRRTGSGSLSSSRSNSSGSEPGIKNNFMNHSYPSPQPQIRRTSSLKARVSVSRRNPKTTIWEFLRPGLVRAPEIELQDIKNRNSLNSNQIRVSVSRNGSSSSTSTTDSSSKNSNMPLAQNPKSDNHKSKQRKQKNGFYASDRKLGFLFGDCRCSLDTIETIPLNYNSMGVDDLEEKLRNLQLKKKKEREKKEQKQALSRNRTFEWLKEIS